MTGSRFNKGEVYISACDELRKHGRDSYIPRNSPKFVEYRIVCPISELLPRNRLQTSVWLNIFINLHENIAADTGDAGERGNDAGIAPCPFLRGETRTEVPF